MTISKSLTWQHAANISISGASTPVDEAQRLWFEWKQALVGFASAAFTVAGSSDGSAAGMDGTDRWADSGDIVMVDSTGARGWIVLQCPTTGLQILVSGVVNNTSIAHTIRFLVSPSGSFSGGSTTSDPSAVDAIEVLNSAYATYGRTIRSANTPGLALHVLRSEGGEATAWTVCSLNACAAFGYVGLAENATVEGLIAAMIVANTYNGVGGGEVTIANMLDQRSGSSSVSDTSQVGPHRTFLGSLPSNGDAPCYLTAPMVNVHNTNTSSTHRGATVETFGSHTPSSNQVLGEFEAPSVGLYCHTAGDRGTHGRLYDMRWANDALQTGDSFPADGSRQWVKMGPVVVPWDGSVPVIA